MNLETIKNIKYLGKKFPLSDCSNNIAVFMGRDMSLEYNAITFEYQISAYNYIFKTKDFGSLRKRLANE